MKLKVKPTAGAPRHGDVCAVVAWNSAGELYSAGDDEQILRFDVNGDARGKVCDLDAYVVDMAWHPGGAKSSGSGGETRVAGGGGGVGGGGPGDAHSFALGCSDGVVKMMTRGGMVERAFEAHRGAVTSVCWNDDGTALLTTGEDGAAKVWSRNGALRVALEQRDAAIYCASWSRDGDAVAFGCGKELLVKPLNPGAKTLRWKAHDGVVLSCDWCALTRVIVSGGEDCRYKTWDEHGLLLFQSSRLDHVVASVRWNPAGDAFAVGSFDSITLCDATGFTSGKTPVDAGTVLKLAWSPDGASVAGAGGNGAVVFGSVAERRIESCGFAATLIAPDVVRVTDVEGGGAVGGAVGGAEAQRGDLDLSFRGDRVVKMAAGHGYLLVASSAGAVSVRQRGRMNAPRTIDVRDVATLLIPGKTCFLCVTSGGSCAVYSYEGRKTSDLRAAGLRPEVRSIHWSPYDRVGVVNADP